MSAMNGSRYHSAGEVPVAKVPSSPPSSIHSRVSPKTAGRVRSTAADDAVDQVDRRERDRGAQGRGQGAEELHVDLDRPADPRVALVGDVAGLDLDRHHPRGVGQAAIGRARIGRADQGDRERGGLVEPGQGLDATGRSKGEQGGAHGGPHSNTGRIRPSWASVMSPRQATGP
jgi:hypothetical protein